MWMPAAERQQYIEAIRAFPAEFRALVSQFSDEQLDLRVAEGEWSIRQIVHHVADSHANAIARLRKPLTEDRPMLPDYALPLEASLLMIDGMHVRFVALLEALTDDQWERIGVHPVRGEMTVEQIAAMYAGHGTNHINQINDIRAKYGF
jgi:hypothetical protein